MNTHPKRVILKISGEVLKGEQDGGLSDVTCRAVVKGVQSLLKQSIEVGIVVGGGNYFRGKEGAAAGMPRTPADQMGMLATLMNGIALHHYFLSAGEKVHVMSALECPRAGSRPT